MVGVLKGYDQLMNLVLDEAIEYLRGEAAWGCGWQLWMVGAAAARLAPFLHLAAPRTPTPTDPEDPMRVTDQSRALGLIVCRGTSVMLVVPTAGTEEIANPFQQEGMEA